MKRFLLFAITIPFLTLASCTDPCLSCSGGNNLPPAGSGGGSAAVVGASYELQEIKVAHMQPFDYWPMSDEVNFFIEYVQGPGQFYNSPMVQGYITFEPLTQWTTWKGQKIQYGQAQSVYFEIAGGNNEFYMTAENAIIGVIPNHVELDFRSLNDARIEFHETKVSIDGYLYPAEKIRSVNGQHEFVYAR